jgi:PDZ domain
VQRVAPDSPAARAGIRPGDQILSAGGDPILSLDDWRRVAANIEVGQPLQVRLKRGDAFLERNLVFHRRSPDFRVSAAYDFGTIPAEQGIVQFTFIAAAIVYVALAVLILLARPDDLRALLSALFLGVCGTLMGFPEGFAVAWRQAPLLLHPLFWVTEINLCVGFEVLLTFVTLFPKPLPHSRLILLAEVRHGEA